MKFTRFEQEILDSILHQVEGFSHCLVTRRATTRILRATLRRIKPGRIGRSRAAELGDSQVDHAVPVAVVCNRILETSGLDRGKLEKILTELLVAVELTSNEHGPLLRSSGLSDRMPADWDGVDVLARYRVTGIEIVQFDSPSEAKSSIETTSPAPSNIVANASVKGGEVTASPQGITTELRFPKRSQFFAPVEAALDEKKNCLDSPIVIHLRPGGYSRDAEVRIDPRNAETFFAYWKSTDSSRFSSRLRAAAAILQRRRLFGRFRLCHCDGNVTIERVF